MSVPSKYTCPTCGATISNITRNIQNHNRTKKHLAGFKDTTSVNTDSFKASEAKRIRDFRASKKSEIGDEKYKIEMKEYKKKYRREQKNKKQETLNVDVNVDELKSDLDEMKSSKGLVLEKEKKTKFVIESIQLTATDNKTDVINKMVKAGKIKPVTANSNLGRISNLYRYIYNKTWDYVSIDWLQDVDRVVDAVNTKYKDIKQKTRSNQYASIAGFLKYFPEQKELYKKYSKLAVDIVEKLDTKTKDNTLSEKQQGRLNWGEIKKVWSKLGDDNGSNSFLRALYAIYTFIPVRRILDYNLMKVVRIDKMSSKKIDKLDKKYNYIFVDKHRRPLSFTIYNYKSGAKGKWSRTNKDDGQYTLNPIPERLATVLQEYIIDENVLGNEFLFGLNNNHQKPYSTNAFSSLVSNNLFQTFANNHTTVNDLRSAYVSWYLDQAKTLNEKEQMAFELGSSVHELLKTYYKLELASNFDLSK
jgi:integrase